jgi:hypothetical protein
VVAGGAEEDESHAGVAVGSSYNAGYCRGEAGNPPPRAVGAAAIRTVDRCSHLAAGDSPRTRRERAGLNGRGGLAGDVIGQAGSGK